MTLVVTEKKQTIIGASLSLSEPQSSDVNGNFV